MIDYRQKKHRKDAFITWFAWSIAYKDCDTAIWLSNYINDRYEHNIEQRYWFAWLYGNTYHLPAAWVIMNEYPDYELTGLERLTAWNATNYKRLRYQTDTKWNKGHLPAMYLSYRAFIGNATQHGRFSQLYQDNEESTFQAFWNVINKNWYKFGRYSTWFYLQQLKQTCNVPINPTSLMLDDYSGSRSHRNGLLLALGMDEHVDGKLSATQYRWLEGAARSILDEARAKYPQYAHEMDMFAIETCLCSYKKLFRHNNGRYLGYYLDRQAVEIMQCERDGWHGIDWDVMWQARSERLDARLVDSKSIRTDYYNVFLDTGVLLRSDWICAQ